MQIEIPSIHFSDVQSSSSSSSNERHHNHRHFRTFFGTILGHHLRATSTDFKDERVGEVIRVMSLSLSNLHNREEAENEIIVKIADYLNLLLKSDETEHEKPTCFHGNHVPSISLEKYIKRLVKYVNEWAEDQAGISSTGIRCALLAVEYLDRAQCDLTPRSIHRYYMIGVLMAVKFTEDFAISNKFWAEVAGCKIDDVNKMEATFCDLLKWNLKITGKDLYLQQERFN